MGDHPPASPFEPSPRVRSILTALLRLAIGLPLLGQGLNGFWATQGMARGGFNPNYGGSPVLDGLGQFLPYVQIVVALAVLLGFFTTVAATAAAILQFLPMLIQVVAVLTTGMPGPVGGFRNSSFGLESLIFGSQAGATLPLLALIWLCSIGWNGWSLDGLVFQPLRGRRREPAPAAANAKPAADRERGELAS